jgi:hypothetical protein
LEQHAWSKPFSHEWGIFVSGGVVGVYAEALQKDPDWALVVETFIGPTMLVVYAERVSHAEVFLMQRVCAPSINRHRFGGDSELAEYWRGEHNLTQAQSDATVSSAAQSSIVAARSADDRAMRIEVTVALLRSIFERGLPLTR